MDSFINHIEINNFKSIRHLEIDGLKKINLFIGKPNVGKSNILEALSLFTIRFFNSKSKLTDILRAEKLWEIFHDGNIKEPSLVVLGKEDVDFKCSLKYHNEGLNGNLQYSSMLSQKKNNVSDFGGSIGTYGATFNDFFDWVEDHGTNDMRVEFFRNKRYIFKRFSESGLYNTDYLYPPFGVNLLRVLELHSDLRKVFGSWFEQYNLKLVMDRNSNAVRIQKEIGKNEVFSLPYSSIADTLQRVIFYKTAISSNTNSVLIFEEPEAHAFPPYIAEFTQAVINSKTNQFFMATHSPYILNDFLENAIDDLAIFRIGYNEGQTTVKALSNEEIHEVYKYGIDLFFNGESYQV